MRQFKKNKNELFSISIFCAIHRTTTEVLVAFSTVNNVITRELIFGKYFVCLRETILIL